MKKYLILFILISCTSNYRPESFNEKMARYVPKKQQFNKVPQITIQNKPLKSRRPASLKKKEKQKVALNNKSLYFITLYDQYKKMTSYTNKDFKDIKVCPQFHSLLVRKPNIFNKKTKKRSWKITEVASKEDHPIWSLPLQQNELKPTVSSEVAMGAPVSKTAQKAINIHAEKTFNELSELCEYGLSDNYFIYENLVGQLSKEMKNISPNEDLQIMVKTSLYFNMILIKTLQKSETKGRGISSVKEEENIYADEIIQRAGSVWADAYLKNY
ncbi:MAG: hypothetical protein ACO20H_02065 [Bacteriovoracaceae bacterium]